jgi:IS4 transposase
MVLSKKGRNVGPKNTKTLVTNLPGVTARQVINIYQRRWPIEIVFKELKSGLGLGQNQVTKEEHRVENSLGIAIIAYLFLLRACKKEIKQGEPWSIFKLQNTFRLRLFTNQVKHTTRLEMKRLGK